MLPNIASHYNHCPHMTLPLSNTKSKLVPSCDASRLCRLYELATASKAHHTTMDNVNVNSRRATVVIFDNRTDWATTSPQRLVLLQKAQAKADNSHTVTTSVKVTQPTRTTTPDRTHSENISPSLSPLS